jgi:subtilisin family serine protease
MRRNLLAIAAASVVAITLVTTADAQTRKRIDRAADLPRFTYKVEGNLEDLVRDDAKFRAFASEVARDTASVLADYDIADKSVQRQLLSVLAQIDVLEGRYDDALRRAAQIKELQEKPADKLLSGVQLRAIVGAAKQEGGRTTEAYRKDVGRRIQADLDALPYDVVQNEVKSTKASAELIGETLALGRVREVLQPVASKAGSLSSDLAPGIVGAKYALDVTLPLKATLVDAYTGYLAAHQVDKPDIWAARNVALPAGRDYRPVTIAVWDSGVDVALFNERAVRDAAGKPVFLSFDLAGNPSPDAVEPIPADLTGKLPQMQARSKGFSDLQSNVDSPEASEVKRFLSALPRDQYKAAIEEIRLTGNYQHGTHVAGIALDGNPYARLVQARIAFQHTLLPDPCPTRELIERHVKNQYAYVDFLRRNKVRVVNMSWGGSARGFEVELEQCNIGKTPEERRALAREYYEMVRAALTGAMAGAPEILFVTSAGNSANDPTFNETYPSSIVLPNLVSVGAVDKAGDEASFTSYGPTVAVHANGYQVESLVPGGRKLALSGTSMAAPQVTNLAAKILAVNPALAPPEVIAIIRSTAEKTADGRRTLINPKAALAKALAGNA